MNKRLFLLISISLFAFGLVSLVLTAASAASIDKPTAADIYTRGLNSTHQFQINNSSQGINPPNSFKSSTVHRSGKQVVHGFSPVDQMRQEAMSAPHSPDALDRVEFWLNQSSMSDMWGHADPDDTITVTTPYEQFNAYADPSGEWSTGAHALYPGDEIMVEASSGYSLTVTIPNPLEAHADSTLGQVWGEIGGWYNQDVEVHNWWGGDLLVVQTDASGAFVATDENMPRGAVGYIRFLDDVNSIQVIYHRPYYDIVPGVRVNYGHDWVESDYEPGFTVWLTLTNSTGNIKATAIGDTGMIPWWGGATGFSTGYNLMWSTWQTPDIQDGDWVYVSFENGYSNQVRVGMIDGELDVAADSISGNIYAPWFTQTLSANCGVWVQDGPGMGLVVDPDGGGYSCDFSTIPFDIIPGMDVGVNYWEPDSDQVINIFRGAAPHLWIYTYDQGDAPVGGNYVLNVDYNNDGDAVAESVTISATLLNGMTYIGDTSGVTPAGTGQPGDPLIWHLGNLPVSWWAAHQFYLFVDVTASLGEQIDLGVEIATTTSYFQGDPESKYSYWSGTVVESDTDVGVFKWPWTWDPLPGSENVYVVNVCGGGNTASDEVTLTDNLPPETTLIDWWMQFPGWEEVSRNAHQLVLTRPSVPPGWCGDVLIRTLLDEGVQEGEILTNTAQIDTINDQDLSNNSYTLVHTVGGPHTNLSVWSDWIGNIFVPGNEIHYAFQYQNSGNLPVGDITVTSTLPADTSFLYAYEWGVSDPRLITPTLITPEYLVWDVGLLEAGDRQNIGIAVRIDPETEAGSLLTHTVSISPKPGEDRYDDNTATWVDRVNEPGPNLSLDKHSNWYWTWEGQLEYELRIFNLGTEYLDNIWITDTYPVDTLFNSNWWQGTGPMITVTHDSQNRQILLWVDHLNPGEAANFAFQVDLDPEVIGEQGLAFTNTVEAPIANDTNPLDNTDTVVAYTGPDVFVNKWLSGGELHPGELVTFTVEFGNQNMWPWDGDPEFSSHITDTLPDSMTFITATAPLGGDWSSVNIDGNTIVWEWGPMWSNSIWTFDIVMQVDEPVLGRNVLINRIEAYGDSLNDIEPNLDNNVSEVRVTQPIIHFPLVFKNH